MSDDEQLIMIVESIIELKIRDKITPEIALRAEVIKLWDKDIKSLNAAIENGVKNGALIEGDTINSRYYKVKKWQ